jgi:hypothetical protein
METNRRSFFAALLAAPGAAWATLSRKSKPQLTVEAVKQALETLYASPTYYRDWYPVNTEGKWICFNCQKQTGGIKYFPKGVHLYGTNTNGGESVLRLCDSCAEAIQHCATCGRYLEDHRGELWLSARETAMHPMSWPEGMGGLHFNVLIKGVDEIAAYVIYLDPKDRRRSISYDPGAFREEFGIRPVARDLIVADCPSCFQLRNQDRIINEICTAFAVPPETC